MIVKQMCETRLARGGKGEGVGIASGRREGLCSGRSSRLLILLESCLTGMMARELEASFQPMMQTDRLEQLPLLARVGDVIVWPSPAGRSFLHSSNDPE